MLTDLSDSDLAALERATSSDYDAFAARGLKLDMTRGKPSPEQLDLAEGMLALPGNRDHSTDAGEDARNYGGLQGLPEARALFTEILGAPIERIVIGNNSSLAVMHDCVAWAMLRGVPGGAGPWSRESDVAFICPVPGYDRHFAICEALGIRMIPVELTPDGPDVAQVAEIAADPAVKGMWCVPQYSNPGGETYSDETVQGLAAMKTGAPDFRLFWDNAYSVHDLGETPHRVANMLDVSAAAGHPDRPLVFASTSKITLAGAGLAALSASAANVAWFLNAAQVRTIGPDKLNQLRHVRFLRDQAGILAHMAKHRAVLAPKFAAVLEALERRLGGTGAARWTKPEGGYFISVDVVDGTAARVVTLAKEAGMALTAAGATWPYGRDPNDRTLRLAPTYPSLADVRLAAEGIAICILKAALEAERSRRAVGLGTLPEAEGPAASVGALGGRIAVGLTIFLAGATGAIGQPLCRLLVAAGHRVRGTTRSPAKAAALEALGVEPVVVDVYDADALAAAAGQATPEIVIHQLTDLPARMQTDDMAAALERNSRLREIGTANLVAAARASGSRRMIAQSLAFVYAPGPLPHPESDPIDPAMRGVLSLEEQVMSGPFEGVVLRYGRIWGPGTGFDAPNESCPVHVEAAAYAAALAVDRGAGFYNIAEDTGEAAIDRARRELGWEPSLRLQGVKLR